jgi:hypothetical protein
MATKPFISTDPHKRRVTGRQTRDPGDQDDGVGARFRWLYGSRKKVLIAFNAPTPVGDILFLR